MANYKRHLLDMRSTIREALIQLNELAADAVVFLMNEDFVLQGALTDGDVRRGFINGLSFENPLLDFAQRNPKFIIQGQYVLQDILELRNRGINIIPVLDERHRIINVVNFKHKRSYLPVDALIMAGGRGERLRPLTDYTPKPLLTVGNKPIIEHNIDRLNLFGIDDIWISLRYLGQQLEDFFKDGSSKDIRIKYVHEIEPLGTAGALSLINDFKHDHILLMNSDLLTNIDFEDFYLFFEENEADFVVACIPYQVNVPYAVMETREKMVTGFKEKPTYTHYSNAGIYLMKREVLNVIPKNQEFNATDLMNILIQTDKSVLAYPLVGYWLDIGRHEDFQKAQQDINQIKL
jgi:dTDP-glucose pyrophosphorylase